MKTTLTLIIGLLFTASAWGSNLKFDSAHTIALDGTISNGKILSTTTSDWSLKNQIKEQLMYVIGQMNGLNGGSPDMNKLEVSIGNKTQLSNGKYEVSYAAKMFLAWPNDVQVPETYTLIVPASGDRASLQKFFNKYGADENSGKKCLAWEAHDVTQGIFWYYYRPQKSQCSLRYLKEDASLVRYQEISLKISKENTKGKFPEYGKVWEDGKLTATLIFGKAKEGATSEYDAGVAAYRDTVNTLIRTYGLPTSSTPTLNGYLRSALKNPTVYMTFNTPSGELDVALFLIEGIRVAPNSFRAEYNERTLISDYVSYSGHSGLGANIRALARIGEFAQDQYQIFLVNGCDTFAYVDDALRNAHAAVNPGFGKDKFVDVITNAMPSYFHMNNRSNMAIINGLVGQRKTYRQILAGFDKKQRAAVTGEQDNNWPAPFLD